MHPRPLAVAVLLTGLLFASTPLASAQEMSFEEYEPRSTLVVPEHPVTRARFPFVDVHNHLFGPRLSPDGVDEIVRQMDELNMAVMVNLSGGSGGQLKRTVAALETRYPDRFVVFASPSYDGIDDPDYPARTAAQLEEGRKKGSCLTFNHCEGRKKGSC
ncbi:MAG: hypothetical protein ACREIA_04240, partial [Opitutaceae bacterium]